MKNKKSGFTLIELLIVISIIAILAAMAVFGIGNVFQKARDTQRKSDLKQYQDALENWANNHDGFYPSRVNIQAADVALCGDLSMSGCPDDPIEGRQYNFNSDGNGAAAGCYTNPAYPCASSYYLSADLEDGEYGADTDYVVCSNGKSGECDNCHGTDMCVQPCTGTDVCPLP